VNARVATAVSYEPCLGRVIMLRWLLLSWCKQHLDRTVEADSALHNWSEHRWRALLLIASYNTTAYYDC
jgi:hypothetical protein